MSECYVLVWVWEGGLVGVLYNKNFIISLQPVAVVSIMHKSGESDSVTV